MLGFPYAYWSNKQERNPYTLKSVQILPDSYAIISLSYCRGISAHTYEYAYTIDLKKINSLDELTIETIKANVNKEIKNLIDEEKESVLSKIKNLQDCHKDKMKELNDKIKDLDIKYLEVDKL